LQSHRELGRFAVAFDFYRYRSSGFKIALRKLVIKSSSHGYAVYIQNAISGAHACAASGFV